MLLDTTWVCVPGLGNCPSARLPLFCAWERIPLEEVRVNVQCEYPCQLFRELSEKWTRKLSWVYSLLANLGSDLSLSIHYKIVWASRFIHWTNLFVFLHNLLSTIKFGSKSTSLSPVICPMHSVLSFFIWIFSVISLFEKSAHIGISYHLIMSALNSHT